MLGSWYLTFSVKVMATVRACAVGGVTQAGW